MSQYDKRKLVPFGEYLPWSGFLSLMPRTFIGHINAFTPGHSETLLSLKDSRFGVLICYEIAFSELSRRAVADGANFLVNLTNDAWYGGKEGRTQALAMAVLCAIETRRAVARVSNRGFSGIINAAGELRIVDKMSGDSAVQNLSWSAERTFYVLAGDWFAESCLAFSVCVLIASALQYLMRFVNRITRHSL